MIGRAGKYGTNLRTHPWILYREMTPTTEIPISTYDPTVCDGDVRREEWGRREECEQRSYTSRDNDACAVAKSDKIEKKWRDSSGWAGIRHKRILQGLMCDGKDLLTGFGGKPV
eukprot:258762-Hanusia_phi.AAC.2